MPLCPNCSQEVDVASLNRDSPTCPACGSSVTQGHPTGSAEDEDRPEIRGYEILRHIGKGGMGSVWVAKQSILGMEVAIKLLAPRLSSSDHFMQRFLREARTLARLKHRGIVGIHDFISDGDLCCIIMEYIDGPDRNGPLTVHQLIRRQQLNEDRTRQIILQVLDALEYAHSERVVHRDVKPSNILIDHHRLVKVVDFGIAALHDDENHQQLTHAGGPLGTLEYMAPEQTEDATSADHRADLYSTGVVLYEMLTGVRPRGAFRLPSDLVTTLDHGWDDVVCQALQPEREERFQSAREMAAAIEVIGQSSGVIATGRDIEEHTVSVDINTIEPDEPNAPAVDPSPAADETAPDDKAANSSSASLRRSPSDSMTVEQIPPDLLAHMDEEGFPIPQPVDAGDGASQDGHNGDGSSADSQSPQTVASIGDQDLQIPEYLKAESGESADVESSHGGDSRESVDEQGPFAPEPVSTAAGAVAHPDVAGEEVPRTVDPAPATDFVEPFASPVPEIPVEADPELDGPWGLRQDTLPNDRGRPQQHNDSAIPFRPFSRPATLLVCLLDDGAEDEGEWFRIRKSRFVIGRKQGDIRLPYDRSLSSRHAEIRLHPIGDGRHDFIIRDLQTTNGTFARVSRAVLDDRQQILLGMRRYEFLKGGKKNRKRTPDALRELTAAGPGKKHLLTRKSLIIGRDPMASSIVLLGDQFISPKHAKLRYNSKGKWVLKNLNSRNGVWVRVNELTICSGGAFQVGSQRVLVKIP